MRGRRLPHRWNASLKGMTQMLVVGLLLLAATGAFTGLLLADNLSGGPEVTVSVLGQEIATMNTLAVFCSGLALALLFCAGAAAVAGGARHRRRSHAHTFEPRPGGPGGPGGPAG